MAQLISLTSFFVINNIIIASLLVSSSGALELWLLNTITGVFQVNDGPQTYLGVCLFSSRNYTRKGEYESNLRTVLSDLTSLASAAATSKTVSNATAGSGLDRVNGWSYCGNHDPSECTECVRNATLALMIACQTRTAIVYTRYNDCQVGYTNAAAFPESDDSTAFTYCPGSLKVPDPVAFNRSIVVSMERLIDEAVASTSRYFATESVPGLYEGQNVTTIVNCLPGISRSLCKECLLRAVNETVVYCLENGIGWAVDYRPSCKILYDIRPFSESPARASSPALPPSPTNSSAPTPGSPGWSVSPLWIIVAAIIHSF